MDSVTSKGPAGSAEGLAIDLSVLAGLSPQNLRAVLPGFLSGFVADPVAAVANRVRIGAIVGGWTDETCGTVLAGLSALGHPEHHLYGVVGPCGTLAREWSRDVVLDPELSGVEHLRAAMARGPTLILGNHLSYFDTTATDAVLAWAGHADLADRIVVAAGPKVYQDLFRVVAAACLNTLPVPQSTSFAHTEKLSPRELARRATESFQAAHDVMRAGYALVLYPEGSRSRTGHLGPFLKGVHRYLSCIEGLSVVPMAIAGTERVMPIGQSKLHPGPVALRFGPPNVVGIDGSARTILETTRHAVAELLPAALRPLAGTDVTT